MEVQRGDTRQVGRLLKARHARRIGKHGSRIAGTAGQAGTRVAGVRRVTRFADVEGTCIGEVRANPIQNSARDKDQKNHFL